MLECNFFWLFFHHFSGIEAEDIYLLLWRVGRNYFILFADVFEVWLDGSDRVYVLKRIVCVLHWTHVVDSDEMWLVGVEIMFDNHFPPPALKHDCLLHFGLHFDLLPGSHEDIVPLQLQLAPSRLLTLVLRDKFGLLIFLGADLAKGVEQSLGGIVVIDEEELISDEHVLFLGDVD